MIKLKLLAFSCFLMLAPSLAYGQSTPTEDPSRMERFIDIFRPPTAAKPVVADTLDTLKKPGVRDQYATVYNLIHREQQAYYRNLADSNHTKWDEIIDLPTANYVSPDGDTIILAKNIKVFGWHPHWMGNTYESYPFQLLSHIALFSYNVNAKEGKPYDNPGVVESWTPDYGLIDLAHADGCKVMLTITSFGKERNRFFLKDSDRQERLINDIVPRMVRMKADGIDIDFELIPDNFEKQFSSFIVRLHDRMAQEGDQYELSVVLPKINGTISGKKVYNMELLQEYVDFFTLTAYDFRTRTDAPGPIAPLHSPDRKRRPFNTIEDVVFNYLEDGLDRQKLILALPNYGARWETHRKANGTDSTTFEHLTYAAIKRMGGSAPPKYDRDAWAAVYRESGASELKGFVGKTSETWFDDSLTLNAKYDWVLEQELGGVGIWALGYDLPRLELWELIDEKFAFAGTKDTLVYYQTERPAWHLPTALLNYRELFGITGLFIFVFLAIGFVVALFDWRVREVFYQKKTLRLLYIIAAFALVTATFTLILFFNPGILERLGPNGLAIFTLVFGLASGIFIVWYISRWFGKRREAAP